MPVCNKKGSLRRKKINIVIRKINDDNYIESL